MVSIWAFIKENVAIIIAVLFAMLCFGLMKVVVSVINNTLLHFANFGRNVWLDWLFVVLSCCFIYYIVMQWFKAKRIVSSSSVGILLVMGALYVYFRTFKSSPYTFTCYWNGPIAYLDFFALASASLVVLYVCQRVGILTHKTTNNATQDAHSFSLDIPIEDEDDDMFNMGSLVNRITSYIAFTDVRNNAFSMGIVGDWGDGKSSLMNLVEGKIKKDYSDFVIVHFNPRASKKADTIQEDFLDELKRSLSPHHSGINHTIDNYAVAIDAIPGVPVFVAKMLSLLQIHIDKNRQSRREVLRNAIIGIGKRIVVFVDDLDRLTGDELIEVMKVLDTNGAFPNMVFLTSYDKSYVNTVLTNHLKLGIQKRPYTDKYFTVEINVPTHPAFRLMKQLVQLFQDAHVRGLIKADTISANTIEEHTLQLTPYLTMRLQTIRDVKRFANQFLYDYAEIQRDVNFHDFLLLEIIKYAYPNEYISLRNLEYIHRGTISFTTTASSDMYYLNDTLLSKKKASGDGVETSELGPGCLDILRLLFPAESDYQNWYPARHLRIFCISSFDHYFYNYEFSHLKTEDIEALFQTATLKEACKMIDSWMSYFKDFETYLLTRSVETIRSQDVLKRYFQYLLYGGYKQPSINYLGQNYSFIRKEDVEKIIKNCGFTDLNDYLAWLKGSLDELFDIDPVIPSSFVRRPIQNLSEPETDTGLFVVTVEYLQNYALELLNRHLALIDQEDWSAATAYTLAHIPLDMSEELLPAAITALHDAMVARFEKFSSSVPMVGDQPSGCIVGYNPNMAFHLVFKDKEEFAQLIQSERFDDAPDIHLVRAIWPLFKANSYQTVTLPKGINAQTAKSTLLADALSDYAHYENVDRELDVIAADWKKGHRLADVDSFVGRTEEVRKILQSIPLRLELANTYEVQIADMINQFKEYELKARNLDVATLREGDFVRMKQDVFEKNLVLYPSEMRYMENIFTVDDVSDDGQVVVREAKVPLKIGDIEAVLVDGKEDGVVYYDPDLAADIIADGQSTRPHNRNYSYYLEQFKKSFDADGESYYEKINKAGIQFVHEIQHWMSDEMQDNGLKLHHTLRDKKIVKKK